MSTDSWFNMRNVTAFPFAVTFMHYAITLTLSSIFNCTFLTCLISHDWEYLYNMHASWYLRFFILISEYWDKSISKYWDKTILILQSKLNYIVIGYRAIINKLSYELLLSFSSRAIESAFLGFIDPMHTNITAMAKFNQN